MRLLSRTNNIPDLYPCKVGDEAQAGPAGPALHHIAAVWSALDALETSLPGGPDRWQAQSLFVAREGMRQAWLALSNLDHKLRNKSPSY